MPKEVVIIGAGGHAKVIADIIVKNNDILLGFLDDNIEKGKKVIADYKVLGTISDCQELCNYKNNLMFIVGIGNNLTRLKITKEYPNLLYYTAIHPNAVIGLDVKVGEGTAIMANACINSNATIGKHCIINTGAIIEHDNILDDFVHVSPNAALAGNVKIGEGTHVGIGATVKNNINIKENNIIGAGAVVVKNILGTGKTMVGVPARENKKESAEKDNEKSIICG